MKAFEKMMTVFALAVLCAGLGAAQEEAGAKEKVQTYRFTRP